MERRERISVRTRRELTRIRRDIRGWIGWDYIETLVHLCENPGLILVAFMTGGRATEILELTRGHFADMGAYYEVRAMPVFKKYDVLSTYVDEMGKKHWETELVTEYRTFPILKTDPLAELFWNFIRDQEGKLFEFKVPGTDELWKDQYWQMYKRIADIPPPPSPLAPVYHKGPNVGQQKNVYPHWFRGMKAAQLRVEYGLSADDLMEFFRWESSEMALHYARLSSVDLADTMIRGRERIRTVMGIPRT